ncbi:hypothetical protein DL240_14705 [Lujinxingia litoralis]|uniref:Uncharacterized protein n=1 Tax=Lujinxingia litoralis TaxID=2211119 RepID=A0A328C359_9DELT|nr:hypothetical protein [Lujinxingia litoralis]RAL20922.1 hypothetical protein DL240_14705 [Lujinxingia litoralis]
MKPYPRPRLAILALATSWMACGGDPADDPAQTFPDPNIPVELDDEPLAVNSQNACTLDLDCAAGSYCFQGICASQCSETRACDSGLSCNERGRCVVASVPGRQALGEETPSVLPGLNFRGLLPTQHYISPGQQSVTLTLELNDQAPASGVAYIARRSDEPDAEPQVLQMQAAGNQVSFELPTGLANPQSADPQAVRVEIISAVGSFTLGLFPERLAGGHYEGVVQIETFGAGGLPFSADIVTVPRDSSLSSAEQAFLVLAIDDAAIFSPARGPGLPETMAAELHYDDFTQSWVATFDANFDLSDSPVIRAPEQQVARQMRFEINLDSDGQLTGQMRDGFAGIYEARSNEGVISLADVTFTGALYATRTGDGLTRDAIDPDAAIPQASPQPLPAPTLDACQSADFAAVAEIDQEVFDCADITSVEAFQNASPDAQAACAIAVSADALSGETTATQIEDYINGVGEGSFAEFMERCARGDQGLCRPSDQVVCGRSLVASAYRTQQTDSTYVNELSGWYLQTSREQFLGQQFGSLSADTETRLEWLSATNYPAIVTNAVRSLNENLLDEWQSSVLDVHFEVLSAQFDTAGLSTLARQPLGQATVDARGELLLEINQNFRTAMESLTIAARRWDVVASNPADRRAKTDYVASRARDLYLAAGVLKNLNRAGDQGFLSSSIGAGFSGLQREIQRLNAEFSELIYARDGEVVVSTSLDPTVSNITLLGTLRTEAENAVERADIQVSEVIARDQAEALSEAELRNRLNNEIDDLKDELVNLCGLPLGCDLGDAFNTPGCEVRVEFGECGFAITQNGEFDEDFPITDLATSEASAALLSVLEGARNVKIAAQDKEELIQRALAQSAATDALAQNLAERDLLRIQEVALLEEKFAELQAHRDTTIAKIAGTLKERQQAKKTFYEGTAADFKKWNEMRIANATAELDQEFLAMQLGQGANAIDTTLDISKLIRENVNTAIPDDADDPGSFASATVRTAFNVTHLIGFSVLRTAQFGLEAASESVAFAASEAQRYNEIELTELQEAADLSTLEYEQELDELHQSALNARHLGALERETIAEALEMARLDIAHDKARLEDVQLLQDRRDAIVEELLRAAGLNLRKARAELQSVQRQMEYGQIAQRAQLLESKLQELLVQREHVNLIVGSPSAVFSRSSRILSAENALEQAKDSLMNWLVALEYYAVRPFMDQRIQILLARNPTQLRAIADEMLRLQNACGGATNAFTAELSLRDDLLGLNFAQSDLDGSTFTPSEVLRQLMQDGFVPVNKRVRYTSDENVGDLLNRANDILAASFYVNLSDFANLGATCNAKLSSVDLQLVGDLGQARPTVSVLYDGTGTLRSCQPGIDSYVDQFGEGTTSFGATTYLRSMGRSISPVAGINTFLQEGSNTTLNGLPLASQYTVLIDTTAGENAGLDWSKLEDIRLRVAYTYQDVFPQGQCQ